MKVAELRAILNQYPDDTDVSCSFSKGERVVHELRDSYDAVYHKFYGTTLEIRYWNGGWKYPYPHLTDAARAKARYEILDGLQDIYRTKRFGSNFRRFTSVHGDWRIYSDFGDQASCYGTAYDPRVFLELEADGLIQKANTYGMSGVKFEITEAGQAELSRLEKVSA